MTAIKMPQLGETVVEGTILKWLKQEGDEVALFLAKRISASIRLSSL